MGWSKIFKAGGSKQILWEYFFHRLTSRAFWQQRALGRRRRGQSFTILQACVVCVNGHNVLQCKGSRWVTQWVTVLHVHSSHKYTSTHTTWVRMGLTMVRGKRERGVLDKCFVLSCPRRPTPSLSFQPGLLFVLFVLL